MKFLNLFLVLFVLPTALWAQNEDIATTTLATQQSTVQNSAQSAAAMLSLPPGTGPVVVNTSFHLQDLNSINDEEETFEFSGILTLSWQDPRQAFDPVKENVKEKLYQGSFQFDEISPSWFPQVILSNESGMYDKQGTLLRIQSDGTCTLSETVNAMAETTLNMRRYPFDTHSLTATFEIFGFDKSEVVFQADPLTKVLNEQDINISQWTVNNISTVTGFKGSRLVGKHYNSSTFEVVIDVQRRSLFIMRLVVIPLILMVMLSWSVFWMDRSSLGDRINVSFIGILTAVAYQIVIGDILPHIAYVTLMNAFLNLSFWIMCATVIVNLRVGALDKHGHTKAGDTLDRSCRIIFPCLYFGLLAIVVVIAFLFF